MACTKTWNAGMPERRNAGTPEHRTRNGTGLGFSARANGPKNLKKSHVIETEFQPGLKSFKQDGCRNELEAISVE